MPRRWSSRPLKEQLLWSGGLMLEFLNGGLEVYFPVAHARLLRDRYAEVPGRNYLRQVSWSIRIGRVAPMDVIQKLAN
ncbi:MAG: hypothetical protein IPH12_06760 [Saprospirales bacterium]|nr:hypothetical protein [Saprospirales bacterium]